MRHFLKQERRTYIAQLEGLAVLAALTTWPARLAGRRVALFIDNTVALSGLVHGYARDADLATIVNAYHLMAAGMRTVAYMDYVPSKANIADLPSRGSHLIPRALGARVIPLTVPSYQLLNRPLVQWLQDGEKHGRGREWPT